MTIKIRLWKSSFVSSSSSSLSSCAHPTRMLMKRRRTSLTKNNNKRVSERRLGSALCITNFNPFNLDGRRTLVFRSFVIIYCCCWFYSFTQIHNFLRKWQIVDSLLFDSKMAMNGAHFVSNNLKKHIGNSINIFPLPPLPPMLRREFWIDECSPSVRWWLQFTLGTRCAWLMVLLKAAATTSPLLSYLGMNWIDLRDDRFNELPLPPRPRSSLTFVVIMHALAAAAAANEQYQIRFGGSRSENFHRPFDDERDEINSSAAHGIYAISMADGHGISGQSNCWPERD